MIQNNIIIFPIALMGIKKNFHYQMRFGHPYLFTWRVSAAKKNPL